MKLLLFISAAVALWLTGCSTKAPEALASSKVPEARPDNTVTISAEGQKASGIATMTVQPQAAPEAIRATARLTNDENRTWRVGSVSEGRIVRIHANQGDVVGKNALLAEMHSHDIHESRALYKRAKADIARMQGVVEYQTGIRDRAKRLLDLRAGSVAQLEQAETELRNAQTDVHNAETELERTRTHLTEVLGVPAEESDVPQSGDGEDNDLIPVRSPATGVILARNVTPGTVVNPANDLFLVSDLTNLWAIAEVNEEYLGKLRAGMPVRAYVQAYPDEPFHGRIVKLGEILDPNTHTIKVRIDLPNAHGKLKPEMYADVEIDLGTHGMTIQVPSEAVQDIRGETAVFVRTSEDHYEMRAVRTGRMLQNSLEIVSGLKVGDEVVAKGAFILKSEFLKASLSGE